jgi:hypothetical protein
MGRQMIGVVALLFMFSGAASAQENQAAGRAKLAEMIAFIRHASEKCAASVPGSWPMEALSLLMVVKPPLDEREIVLKEKEVEQYRVRLGLKKWCELYAVEMGEAHAIVELRQR